jgi:hypothetical protein
MRALYGTLKKAKSLDPNRFKEYKVVVREFTRVRAIYRRKKKVKFKENYFEIIPGVEINKQID